MVAHDHEWVPVLTARLDRRTFQGGIIVSLRLSVQVLVSPPANPALREDLQDVKQDIRDLRGEIRHSMVVTMGYTTILMDLLAAFLQYRLPPG